MKFSSTDPLRLGVLGGGQGRRGQQTRFNSFQLKAGGLHSLFFIVSKLEHRDLSLTFYRKLSIASRSSSGDGTGSDIKAGLLYDFCRLQPAFWE